MLLWRNSASSYLYLQPVQHSSNESDHIMGQYACYWQWLDDAHLYGSVLVGVGLHAWAEIHLRMHGRPG